MHEVLSRDHIVTAWRYSFEHYRNRRAYTYEWLVVYRRLNCYSHTRELINELRRRRHCHIRANKL